MDSPDSASLRGVLAVAVLAAAAGVWSGCPPGDGGQDGGQDSGEDSGSQGDGGADAGPDGGGDAGADAGGIDPSMTVSDQSPALSTQVAIGSVTAAVRGWVVVSAPLNDGGIATGFTAVPAGTTEPVQVAVSDPLADGTAVSAELHSDLGVAGTYEPGTDPPVSNDAGAAVAGTFRVAIPSGTPAVRYTFIPSFGGAAFAWRASAEPARFAGTLGSTGDNPQLTLFSGWRYEVVNTAFSGHPFELANAGGADLVLLSQASDAGTLKDDPTIAWVDGRTTGGASRFTLSPTLQAQLNLYRCQVHFSTMRGPIAIQAR